jgi:TPP-dependent 2-oxoacid decarboxylase
MKTAVEWQFEQMFNSFEKFNNGECTFNDYLKRNLEIREQAKEMEKEQIIEARIDGHNAPSSTLKHYDAAQYYNETFKQQEQ